MVLARQPVKEKENTELKFRLKIDIVSGFPRRGRVRWMQISVKYHLHISLVGRVFANGPGDLGSIPSRIKPKTLKMVFDNFLLNTQQYKVRIKGKVEQYRESSNALPYTSV